MSRSTELSIEILPKSILSFTNNCWKDDATNYPNQEKHHKRQSQHFVKRFESIGSSGNEKKNEYMKAL